MRSGYIGIFLTGGPNIATLYDFDTTPAPPKATYNIASARRGSGKTYPVDLNPDYCPCKSFDNNGDCIHVQKARNIGLLRQNQYLRTRYEREATAAFPSFEAVLEHFCLSRSHEVEYLACLFLGILLAGEATTDDLYVAVGGEFSSDPRIVGVVTRVLREQGWIRPTGRRIKSRRKKIHGDMQPIYVITEAGREALGGLT